MPIRTHRDRADWFATQLDALEATCPEGDAHLALQEIAGLLGGRTERSWREDLADHCEAAGDRVRNEWETPATHCNDWSDADWIDFDRREDAIEDAEQHAAQDWHEAASKLLAPQVSA